jgi:hypothetical protein
MTRSTEREAWIAARKELRSPAWAAGANILRVLLVGIYDYIYIESSMEVGLKLFGDLS